jgi:hypothetical protein
MIIVVGCSSTKSETDTENVNKSEQLTKDIANTGYCITLDEDMTTTSYGDDKMMIENNDVRYFIYICNKEEATELEITDDCNVSSIIQIQACNYYALDEIGRTQQDTQSYTLTDPIINVNDEFKSLYGTNDENHYNITVVEKEDDNKFIYLSGVASTSSSISLDEIYNESLILIKNIIKK